MSLLYEITPPIITRALLPLRNAIKAPKPLGTFSGDGAMFERIVSKSRVYGEYGVGESTNWVYDNTDAKMIAVDSSPEWAATVCEGKDRDRLQLERVDLGVLGKWGRPRDYSKRENFPVYVESIWSRKERPDTVLVDGRLRVCCFLTSLLRADPDTVIIFDDYTPRGHYHIVEEVLKPEESCGRQAMFRVPTEFDRSKAASMAEQFSLVMD